MSKPRGSWIGGIADKFLSVVSGEWILEWTPYTANGGTVVAARSVWLTLWLFGPAFVVKTAFGEGKLPDWDFRQGAADFVDTLPWLGAIFGASYIALYTRFSSLWTYLASRFNQIVQAQLTMPLDKKKYRLDTMASWKAAFIEDAQDLHLAAKPMFLVAVCQWGSDGLVAKKFATNTVGGAERLTALLSRLAFIRAEAEKQLSKKSR
jgi:hypothetical protein